MLDKEQLEIIAQADAELEVQQKEKQAKRSCDR
jgi:hypothetical protein